MLQFKLFIYRYIFISHHLLFLLKSTHPLYIQEKQIDSLGIIIVAYFNMCEMLGNHFFLLKEYDNAKHIYEELLNSSKFNISIKIKLILCLIATNKIKKAFSIFYDLIINNSWVLLNSDLVINKNICSEMIYSSKKNINNFKKKSDFFMVLGMLYAFVDTNYSIRYFRILKNITKNKNKYKYRNLILTILIIKNNGYSYSNN